jgi:glycosyltransferase involved in cell wall biosynthesis
MRILLALTYYRPHVSGLTIYVERLAHALARRGHQTTVLTSQYDRSLPREETSDGVRILRVPVAFRVSKGVVMPTIGIEATRQVRTHDVLSLHLPQLDAAGIALRGRLMRKPTLLTYHCDLRLPKGYINDIANVVVNMANRAAAAFAHGVVAYTEDFALHSPYLSRYMKKLHVIPPPVEVHEADEAAVADFVRRHRRSDGPVIGMAARLATEKGVEYLLEAMPRILERHPKAEVLFVGQHVGVLGEAEYALSLALKLERFGGHWKFLGVLDPQQMGAFYRACDLTVLPSVNATESFGLVQIEAMMCGTPVVASNLPGVRQPVLTTGMGKIVPIRDPDALAQAVLEVLDKRESFQADPVAIAENYSPDRVAEHYEDVFSDLLQRLRPPKP